MSRPEPARGWRHPCAAIAGSVWLAIAPPVPAVGEGSIGMAWRERDGTIVLQLRAESGAARGDALLRYPPSHPRYREVARHVGPLPARGAVPVRPFPRASAR